MGWLFSHLLGIVVTTSPTCSLKSYSWLTSIKNLKHNITFVISVITYTDLAFKGGIEKQ